MEIGKGNDVLGIPDSVRRIFGEDNLFDQSKETHKHVKHLTLQMLGSHALKLRMIQDIDLLARRHIEIGAMSGCLDIKETASKVKTQLLDCQDIKNLNHIYLT